MDSLRMEQLMRLRNLNVELMETLVQSLSYIRRYAVRNNLPLPTEDKFIYLLRRVYNLLEEINEEIALPKALMLSDDFLQGDESDEDFTESYSPLKRVLR